jgi:hypothetical protein
MMLDIAQLTRHSALPEQGVFRFGDDSPGSEKVLMMSGRQRQTGRQATTRVRD